MKIISGFLQGCQPYPFAPCDHFYNGTKPLCPSINYYPSPKCEKSCDDSSIKFEDSLYYANTTYVLGSYREQEMQVEIMRNGPVVAELVVYQDFTVYKKGKETFIFITRAV